MDALNIPRAVVLACWPSTDALLDGVGTDAALFELAGKPLVQRVVEQAVGLGARHVDIVLGDNATAYQDRLGDGERWGCTIAYHYAPAGACLPSSLARQLAQESDCLLQMADAMLPAGFCPRPGSFGGLAAEGELAWPGWARLPGSALLAATARSTSPRAVFLALCSNRELNCCRDATSPHASDAAALLNAAKSLLRAPDYPIGIARRPVAEGLWIGNGTRIHPTARVIAPAFLGDHVLIAADAIVGPDAVIGARSVVDRGATVVGSLVAPASYVGAAVELREAILSGRCLVNVALETRLDIPDRELVGPAAVMEEPTAPPLAERLLAGVLWATCWPLAKGAGAGPRRAAAGERAADFVLAICRGERGAWVRHFRAVLHPGLAQVVLGRRRIVGPLPASAADAAPGLLNDVLHLGPDGLDPALRHAADTLSARERKFTRTILAVLRYAGAVAVDWRSPSVPGAQAAPTLVRDP